MNKRDLMITLMLTAAIASSMFLASCGAGMDMGTAGGTDMGTVTGNTEGLTLLYEGFSEEIVTYPSQNGEVEARIYQWLFENTSGEEIEYVDYTIKAFDENGKSLSRDFSPEYSWPNIKPGERTWVETCEGEWESMPASFCIEISKVKPGKGKGEPMSVTASDMISHNDYMSVYELTIRNDGGNEVTWYKERTTFLPMDAGRQFDIIGADKDADGNIVYAQKMVPTADENTFAELNENITIAPGEEIKVLVWNNNYLQDPEFMLCWW